MTKGLVVWGGPGRLWYMNHKFIKAHCTTLHQITYPNEKPPLFLATITLWNIRSVQHGNKAFARNLRNRATYWFGWEYEIPTATASSDEIKRLVKKQARTKLACFLTSLLISSLEADAVGISYSRPNKYVALFLEFLAKALLPCCMERMFH